MIPAPVRPAASVIVKSVRDGFSRGLRLPTTASSVCGVECLKLLTVLRAKVNLYSALAQGDLTGDDVLGDAIVQVVNGRLDHMLSH